ncbi:hypothetical protein GTS_54020 [Gandjariella thermophila]|uniref:Uncharacterized protein n=1 Tax=Gandjariella thermophila TaxID=1931992 RepID=A0A4D4JHK9_9PSEU|nr:hypothetical protein GTS_54020 [Gandjariella thermophila]
MQRHGGRVRLLSGENDDPHSWQQQAARFLRETFPDKGPGLAVLSRHVEIQLAVRLRHRPTNEVVHEVLVIDRVVCGRDPRTQGREYTCDTVLPFVLDEGATLTVVEHDGARVTYRGRGRR